ncbi:catalase-like isoform X1 [Ranitomeya variabilis]|uniref:catalase-like isoform X1 n=1 Tax=Ranitomeya variabilis TaxID=490064 RepID=UPI004056D94C
MKHAESRDTEHGAGIKQKPHHGLEQWPELMTTSNGDPIGNLTTSLTAGPRGPVLLQDAIFIEEISHFVRERIPERVVHARGAGAFGCFEVTHDITKYCKAQMFQYVGKKTPVAVRFSTTTGETGTSELVRDPRGFAVKFYTQQGNWDIVGNNTPIFFIRDPILFPSLSHAQKRNPQTHRKDPNMLWDFLSLRPETLHEVTHLFSDKGIPDGYRHMDGFSNHAFKLVNAQGEAVFAKFQWTSNQGLKNLPRETAKALAGKNPDYANTDLQDAINKGNFPSWTLCIQVMTPEQVKKMPFNPFDVTKVWYEDEFPLIPIGKFTLNRNPVNFFAEVEQIAFSPSNLVPGIEPSPDKVLHGRMFAYGDAQRYRLGVNFAQIPVNSPMRSRAANVQRDGLMAMGDNQGNAPTYYPNSYGGPQDRREYQQSSSSVHGDVARYDDSEDDNVSQVRKFYLDLSQEERQRLCENIAESLSGAQRFIQKRAVKNFSDVHPEYGRRVLVELDKLGADKQAEQSHLTPILQKVTLH